MRVSDISIPLVGVSQIIHRVSENVQP